MMNPFDDTLPEESEPQYKELTTLLQQAYSKPVSVTPDRQVQILARVCERLVQTAQGGSLNGNLLVPVSAFMEKSANEEQEESLNGNLVVPQPGVLNSIPHQAESPAGKPRRDKRRLRLMALLAAAMIVAVLLGTPLLLLRPRLLSTGGYNHATKTATKTPAGLPTLTLSPHVATLGTTIRLSIKNFKPSTRVALTRDIQEPIHLAGGSSILTVGPAGSANVAVTIDSGWGTGFHLIVAEDLTTRYTASATLLITGKGSTQTYDSFVATNGIMFGFDAQHTHFNPFEHLLNPTTVGGLTKKWAYQTGGTVFSSPAVAGGVVYVGCACGYLYALDAASGAKKWVYWTGGSQDIESPAVVGGMVYFGSEDHTLYALDAASGTKKWAYQTGGTVFSSPAVEGGVVYVGSDDGNVYALDAASGAKKWVYHTGDLVESSPAVAGGVVYVGSHNGNVYALDAASGAKKWVYHTGNYVYSSPAVAYGVVYVGSGDGNVYALNAASGAKKWAYHTGIRVEASPAVAGGVVYVGSVDDGTLYALDAGTGAKKWVYRTNGQMFSPPTVANGVVYVGSDDGNVYALDAVSGAKKLAYPIGGGRIDSSPAVADGVVYVSADVGVYAFHLPGT